jgi:formylglycine-generating enzyme required for sulfatase activity
MGHINMDMDNIVKLAVHKEIIVTVLIITLLLTSFSVSAGVIQNTLEPKMITIAGGKFIMGCIRPKNCDSNEQPAHQVTVPPFNMSTTEVTFKQWDNCYDDKGCTTYPNDEGWGRNQHPVINVSWDDAQQYVMWLNKKTGKHYRLPNEAEWEYAARANTQTFYAHGDCITNTQANFDARFIWNKEHCKATGTFANKTHEVGHLVNNAFGLYDMHGNVWEWTQDCFHKNYQGAPTRAIEWEDKSSTSTCKSHVLRGGSWHDLPWDLRSAVRQQEYSASSNSTTGFRIVSTN